MPLSRVRELLLADAEEFTRRSRRSTAAWTRRSGTRGHRERVAELAAGDRLALPPDAVAYLERLRELGVPEHAVGMERDAWILVAAQIPAQMPSLMAIKRGQIENPAVLATTSTSSRPRTGRR